MERKGWKRMMIDAWAFIAIAVIAFVGGLLVGDLGASPETETVYVSGSSSEAEGEAGAPEPGQGVGRMESGAEGNASSSGSEIFTSGGCGSCHILAAAGSSGKTGPDLNEFLAPDDTTEAVEEMIVDPNTELAEGYPGNVMPTDYGQTLSPTEVHRLAEYLVATTPAKPDSK